jgi:hypothetical protein
MDITKIFRNRQQQYGALRMLDILMRYFLRYQHNRFTGGELLRLADWYRAHFPSEARERFDAASRNEASTVEAEGR